MSQVKPRDVEFWPCQACGNPRLTKFVIFRRNTGMLYMREEHTRMGNFCKTCIHKVFWTFELKNIVLGPWGVKSALITPIFFVQNIFSYGVALYKLRGSTESTGGDLKD